MYSATQWQEPYRQAKEDRELISSISWQTWTDPGHAYMVNKMPTRQPEANLRPNILDLRFALTSI